MPKVQRLINRKPFVLVTGAAGFVAYHTIEEMLRSGTPVLGMDCFDSSTPLQDQENNIRDLAQLALDCGTPFDFHEYNVRHLTPQSFANYHIHAIIHLAAKAGTQASHTMPDTFLETNLDGALKVLEFARSRDIARIVMGSSSAVYGESTPTPFREDAPADRPPSPYAASKRAAELYAATWSHLYGMTVACVRLFSVYGPRQRPEQVVHTFVRQIMSGRAVSVYGDGRATRDYTHVTDVVTGILRALDWTTRAAPGAFEAFNLGAGHPVALSRLVEIVEGTVGKKARIERATEPAGHVRSTSADLKKSAGILGYRATVGIEAGVRDFVRWYIDHEAAETAAYAPTTPHKESRKAA